jgi:hypothetical protein
MRTRILLLLCAALAAFSLVAPASAQLLITEFMAANGSGLKDEDGAYSDWIEIYNSASTNVNAGGWYLTDNEAQLTKWQFPSTNIAPNSFIIVFASGKNRRVTGQPLHANFSLAAGGEYLALVKPGGVIKASEFPSEDQYQDLSYGFIMTGVPTTLLPAGSSARAFVPGGDIGTSWRNIVFDDSGWQSGTIGVGYDRSTNYLPAIGLNVGATMSNVNASAYMRVPFTVADPTTYKSLQLRMRYDDGFVAYLNGTEVLRRNAPTTPQWNSSATANHGPPAAGQLVQNFDGTPVNYVLQQNNAAPPPSVQPAAAGTTGNFLRLVSDPVNNQFNSLTFAQTAPGAFEKITADFDFRITDAAANPADGFALMFIPTATYGTNGNGITVQPSFGIEEPNYPGVFAIGFDVYPHATANDVSVHWNGSERLNVSMPRTTLEMVAAQFHHVKVTLLHVTGGARVTVTFTANINGTPAAPYTPITNFFVPDLNAYDCRVQFAARTGGADMHVDLDNINVQFTPPPALVAFEDFDITPYRNLLVAGNNVLAVHGLNLSAANEDFLIEPQLIGADFLVSTQVNYLTPATPGSWNNVSAAGRLSPVTFFPPPGAYTSNSLEVTLTSESSSSVIRFTLDGSTPTENSFQYIAPLNIGANTVLRARTFQAGSIESEVTAANYVLIGDSLTNFTSNLPLFIIDTSGGNIVADSRIPSYAVMLETNGPGNRTTFNATPDWQGRIYVELKGQSSLGFPKNSMNVELNTEDNRDKSDSLLGMPAGSDWVLYAPYTDKTLMNDYLTFELHEAMGHYAVRRRFVEVFVRTTALKLTTNEYRGIFVLLEKIRIDNDRVDISNPQSGQPGDPITGGYIFKRDKGSPGDIEFTTLYQTVTIAANGVAMQYHDPDGTDLTPLQRSWLTNHLNEYESVLYGPNWRDPLFGYRKYINVDSLVDQHWIVDFPKNIDGYRLSNYMYKDRGEKIRMEPIWDWNLSWGNANYLEGGYTNNWYHPLLGGQDDIWLSRLRTDPDFYQKIIDRWGQLRTNVFALSNLLARVSTITNQLNEAQVREFQRWPRLSTYVWPNPDGANLVPSGTDGVTLNFDVNYATPGTYPAMIGEMKKWITGRHAWVEARFLRAPTLSRAGGQITNGTPLSITAPLGAIYYTLDGTDPRAPGGAISSSALLYSGTISLTGNAGVFARAFLTNGWSPPASEVFVITPPTLTISEIMYHPEDPPIGSPWSADDFEFLEIKNTGANAIDLRGARLGGGIDFSFQPSVLVPTGTPTSNSFSGGGTSFTSATLNGGGAPDGNGQFMRLIHGGSTNLARNRIAFNQTAAGPYGRVTADFDFRATTVPPAISNGAPTLQNFDVAGAPYVLSSSAVVTAADAGSQGSFLRLVPAVNSLAGAVGFDRSAPGTWNTVKATFDFRITPGAGQADGMSFALLNTASFGTNGASPALSEEANVANSLGIGIDDYNNAEVNNNHISLHWNNAIVGSPATPPFDFSNGQFHRMEVIVRMSGGRALVTVRMTPNINGTPGPTATLFQDQVINGVNPYEMRAAFGARTGGENAAHDIDNVNMQFSNEGGTSGGLSMLLLPKTPFGTNGAGSTLAQFTDTPTFSNTFALDLTFHPSNYVNDATLYWNGANIGSAGLPPASLNIDNGLFHHMRVELTRYLGGSYATVVITPDVFGTPGTPLILMSNQYITGLLPGDARVEFAGRNGMIDTSLDLDNVHVRYEAFDSLLLGAGESILVVNNLAAFESRYGTGFRIAGEYDGNLNNAGDHIILYGPVGEVLLDFSYSDDWYKISDGLGFSLVNRSPGEPADFNTPDAWRNSTYQGGSPGVVDPVVPIAPVVVNEVLANSVLPDVDLIELHNPTPTSVNIGGWFLTDDLFTPKKFRIPNGTTLAPGGFIVFNESDFNPVPGSPTSFLLGSDGDEIWLFSGDANTNLTGYVHGFDFGPSEEGVSFGRYVDGSGDDHFVAQIANTFNATNAGPRVGPVVISEIMYRPPDIGYADNDLDEYIELHNTAAASVDLFSAALPTDTWQFTEGVEFVFPLNVTLAAGERALVVGFDPANATLLSAFRNKFNVNPAVQIFGPWSGKLDNSTDDVELRRPLPPGTNGTTYTLVDKVDYRDSGSWSPAADGYGASLHRLNGGAYGNDSANWVAATPTPGTAFGGGTAPGISAQPTNTSVLAGDSTSFSVSVQLPGGTFYQWRAFGTNINGGTNATLLLPNVQLADAGEYHVAAYNLGGSALSTPAYLSVLSPVVFTLQPASQDVAPGTNVTIVAAAVGNGPITYQWRFNGTNILDATNASYSFVNANLNDYHGNFSVVASDAVSSTVSSNAEIFVLVRPGIVTHIQPMSVLQGSTFTLSIVATGAPPLWYRWIRSGSGYATTSVPALVISNYQATTTFRVGVTNKAAPAGVFSPTSGSITVTMIPDGDGDGLADSWEIAYFGGTNAGNAALDSDGDLMSNGDEYRSGTNPTNALSVLKVIFNETNANVLSFVAQTNLSYSVQWRTNLVAPSWVNLTNIFPSNQVRTITVNSGAAPPGTERYFRVVTPLVP